MRNSAGLSPGPTVFRLIMRFKLFRKQVTNTPETQKRGSPRDNLFGVIKYGR